MKLDKIKILSPEPVDRNWLELHIQRLKPIQFGIDSRSIIKDNASYNVTPWSSLFYSAMMANHYKKLHEAKNNFRYDCVVRGRFDIIFQPNLIFRPHKPSDRTLYHPHLERALGENSFLNASDPFFYGDSWAMDIVSDIFRNVERDHVNMLRMDNITHLGPGTLMSRYCLKRNVRLLEDKTNIVNEVIYRKEMLGKDPIKDFAEIKQNHQLYYE
jgi:hypothetical protein